MKDFQQHIQKAVRLIPIQIGLLALFFCIYHLSLKYIMRETGLDLGAVGYNKHVVPLYAQPSFDLSLWILPALAVCVGFPVSLPQIPAFGCIRWTLNRHSHRLFHRN